MSLLQAGASGSLTEHLQVPRDIDLSPGQLLQSSQPSSGLGVIGRRSVSDLGAIGDNLTGSAKNSGAMHNQLYNLQMLEAAYHKLPQPKDSERARTYIPVWMCNYLPIIAPFKQWAYIVYVNLSRFFLDRGTLQPRLLAILKFSYQWQVTLHSGND